MTVPTLSKPIGSWKYFLARLEHWWFTRWAYIEISEDEQER